MSDLLDPAHCSQSAEWSVGFPAAVCDETVNFHRLAFNNPSPSSLVAKNVILTNSHGIKNCIRYVQISYSCRRSCNLFLFSYLC